MDAADFRPAKRVKEARTWSGGKVSKAEADDLNRSEPADANGLTNGDAPVDVRIIKNRPPIGMPPSI